MRMYAFVGFALAIGAVLHAVRAEEPPQTTPVEIAEKMLVSLRLQPVRELAPPALLAVTGRVQYADGTVARIFAPVAGQVRGLVRGLGDHVARGEELFRVASRDVATALADEVEVTRELDLTARTLKMTRELFDQKVASRMALVQAENEQARATARLARARQLLSIYGVPDAERGPSAAALPVRAPLSGTIVERALVDGQFVQADSTALMTIADTSTVWVSVDVFEGDLGRIVRGAPATVRVPAVASEPIHARIDRIGETVDTATRAVSVRLVVPNPDGRLKPEMFVEAGIEVDRDAGYLVPATSVFNEGGQDQVYVGAGMHRFARRAVTLGAGGDGWARVTHGLAAGDTVVTSGALLLRQEESEQELARRRAQPGAGGRS